jgi:hypothetical protein
MTTIRVLQSVTLEVSMTRLLWTQRSDFGPSPRFGHAMAFDSNRSRVVLFGGFAFPGGPLPVLVGDTWEWDGDDWTQVDDMGPSPRLSFAMAYDRNRGRLVLFGGQDPSNAFSGETWEWDGQDWTQASDMGPQPRVRHAMAFDSSKNTVTLFGGDGSVNSAVVRLNDTWEWDGHDWAQQADTGPAQRSAYSMAYDDNRQRLVLFGGFALSGQPFGDTWEWDGTAWTQRSLYGPTGRSSASLVFTGATCSLFGGDTGFAVQKDTWTWDGTHWTARQDIGPNARSQHAAVFDSVRQRVVLFGGSASVPGVVSPPTVFGDTWELNADVDRIKGPPGLDGILREGELPDKMPRTHHGV